VAKREEIIQWTPDMPVLWTVEPCVDGRYAYLTLRDAKGRLVTIPGSTGPWNEAYVHMNRMNCQMLADYLNKLVNENTKLRENL
jgi:hypothetical protein